MRQTMSGVAIAEAVIKGVISHAEALRLLPRVEKEHLFNALLFAEATSKHIELSPELQRALDQSSGTFVGVGSVAEKGGSSNFDNLWQDDGSGD